MAVVRGERPAGSARIRGHRGHGHDARSPHTIPAAGWWRILRRVARQVLSDRLMVQSAGVAFFAVLSVAPVLVTALSIYGVVNTPEAARRQLSGLADVLPPDLESIVTDQLTTITAASTQVLTFRGLTGLVFALWTAATAMSYLLDGLGLAYHEPETRSFPRRVGLALVFVLGGAVLLAALFTVVGLATPGLTPSSGSLQLAIRLGSWVSLAVLMAVALAVLYRYGPARTRARLRWLTPGSVLATVVWLAVTFGFFSYVQGLGSYQSTYGSLAGVAISMFWLWTTVLLIFFGAAVNAEAERQTVHDSTVGPERPAGSRGAVVADDTPPYPGD